MLDSRYVKEEKLEIDGIPCLKFSPRQTEELLPAILYYHGWSSNKENQRFKAIIMASFGYIVVVPDALHHGERNPIEYNEENLEKYFWDIVINSVQESKKLIARMSGNNLIDPDKMGVMGHSMGGFTAAGVFVENKNLNCLVNINGSSAWGDFNRLFIEKNDKAPVSFQDETKLARFDPVNNKEKLNLRPVLLLHGDSDTFVPIDSQRIFYKKIAPLYEQNPEKLKLVEVPAMNHYISTGMLEEGIRWFDKYL